MEVGLRTKLFFWIILGMLSTFFAEVVSGSDMFPFFSVWGILVVTPLYTLHILALSYLVYRRGNPNFYALFIAGSIFGMYEAYITKVLWVPTWDGVGVTFGGVAVFESLLLVLWWHPIMAFMIPIILGELILTSTNGSFTGLPSNVKNRLTKGSVILIAILFGIIQSGNSPSIIHSILSGFLSGSLILIFIRVWRDNIGGHVNSMENLVPNRRQFYTIMILLGILYISTGILLRPEFLPSVESHIIIWASYGILLLLLKKLLKFEVELTKKEVKVSYKFILILIVAFSASSTLLSSLPPIGLLISMIVGVPIGIIFFLLSVRKSLR